MTAQAQEATSRLSEIWRQWGMKLPNDEAKSQREALAALAAHLQTSDAALVRAMQALLVDPEQPGAHKRPLFTDFWKVVQKKWATAGAGESDLLFLQAMLLAVWPNDATRLPSTLLSPWAHLAGRRRQFDELVEWRDSLTDECLDDNEPAPTLEESQLDLAPFAAITNDLATYEAPALAPNHAKQLASYDRNATGFSYTANCVLEINAEPFAKMVAAIAQISAITQHNFAALQSSSTHSFDSQNHAARTARTQELLWWGQARYSHLAHQPFRRITDPIRVIWLAAREAAERAYDLPIEPSASYLQETLAALGHGFTERRPLWDWLTCLRPALNSDRPDKLPADLAKLLDKDALGLPVTLLCRRPDVADAPLRSALGAPADAMLDLGEWAAWVFRELVFQHRWQETEQ
jgi:hypothetical protein